MVPLKIKNRLTSNYTSGYIPQIIENRVLRTYVHNHVCSSIIHNSQKVEATQVSIGIWMDKQNVVYPYNEILFSLKNKGNSDTCYNMDEPLKTSGWVK